MTTGEYFQSRSISDETCALHDIDQTFYLLSIGNSATMAVFIFNHGKAMVVSTVGSAKSR